MKVDTDIDAPASITSCPTSRLADIVIPVAMAGMCATSPVPGTALAPPPCGVQLPAVLKSLLIAPVQS